MGTQPRRSFVLHAETSDGPLVVQDLRSLERVELRSIGELGETLRNWLASTADNSAAGSGRLSADLPPLTAAESRVAALAAQGVSNKGIALALGVKLRTVESHLTSSYRKLGVETRRELAQRVEETWH
jgi:DNA-binding NarL/FixJ family response regulator